jgi:Fe-S cluster assembly protein SufD
LRGREHVDIHLDVQHNARDTRSDVFWRGVADQRARGIFHGAITVAVGADGADAKLSNKNLLLSPHAEIDTQPVLEIYADEVKASHGATVGQLDESVMFYLRSRGITAPVARNMLIAAFCREVFDGVADPALRETLDALLTARLPAAVEGVA